MKEYLQNRLISIIRADSKLNIQFDLLTETTNRLSCETHIKGGFCRDLILSILSKAIKDTKVTKVTKKTKAQLLSNEHIKPFDKKFKDIDIATNADPEEFSKTLFNIAKDRGLNPIDCWNNGDKTDKGKNISVWCVKLFKGVEALDIVHFRTDSYDPQTGKVEIVDVVDSFSDDFRRDIPWPSIRVNDMTLVDYFGILDRMNSGIFIITTPPKRVFDMIIHEFNPIIHYETVERILRLFKFITTPYDRRFAYGYNSKSGFTQVSERGFVLDPNIVRFYSTDVLTIDERIIRDEIYQNLVRWRDNGLLANVFNSLKHAVSKRPYQFIQFLINFRILDILFDSNHDTDVLLSKTKIVEDKLISTNRMLSKPYSIFGFGCRDINKLQKIMALFSIDKTTIRLTQTFHTDILLNEFNLTRREINQQIISNVYKSHNSSYESELREFYSIVANHIGVDIDDILIEEFDAYYHDMRTKSIFRPILIDYLLAQKLNEKDMIRTEQFVEIRDNLEECLEARLNGQNLGRYPKIQKMVESNYSNLTKSEMKNIRKIINMEKKDIIDMVDNSDNILALGKIEAKRLWKLTFRLY